MNDRRAVETGKKRTFNPDHCEVSGKAIFRTRRKALRANGKFAADGERRSSDAYICRYCGHWHATHRRQDA